MADVPLVYSMIEDGEMPSPRPDHLRKAAIIGWSIELAGMALWLYGYFATGNPPLVDWNSSHPVVDCGASCPTLNCEIGMILVIAGMVPLSIGQNVEAIRRHGAASK